MLSAEKRIKTKQDLKRFIQAEKKLYGVGGVLLPVKESHVLAKHAILLRKTEYHCNTKHKLRYVFYRVRLRLLQNKYCLQVPLNCCDEGLHIMHLTPILMNSNVTVGKYCSFHMNTALVAGGTNHGVPTLGDGCVLGVGAVIAGDVTLANYIAVGANAYVNKSFEEENIAIAGVPAKKISNNGAKAWGEGINS